MTRLENSDTRHASDLACERGRIDTKSEGVKLSRYTESGITVEKIDIETEAGERELLRPIGQYTTLHTGAIECLDDGGIASCKRLLFKELSELFCHSKISGNKILAVGLGAEALTPDALGPKTIKHIQSGVSLANQGQGGRTLMAISAGVLSDTGIHSHELVSALCDRLRPDAVIIIDALASVSPKRLSSCFQLNNTGIFPGSGLGSRVHPISMEAVGVPVIAIGVPTVLRTSSRASDFSLTVCKREIDLVTEASAEIIAGAIRLMLDI